MKQLASKPCRQDTDRIHDFICVGAGPANLSLAAQASRSPHANDPSFLCLEKNDRVGWHPGMLLPGSRMDTHFAKDLVTMVDPTSEFTFLNFLSDRNRLSDFLNCGTVHPYRRDFDDYLRWAADKLAGRILTGQEVVRIEETSPKVFSVTCKSGSGGALLFLARNIVVGAGGRPKYICGLDPSSRAAIHTSEFLARVGEIPRADRTHKVLVVGSGQSASEVAQYLLQNTLCKIHVSLSDYAFLSKEGTAFINESYNGEFVDRFFNLSAEMRRWFKGRRSNMNYGVVDSDLLDGLYNDNYYQKHFNDRSLTFRPFTRVQAMTDDRRSMKVTLVSRETGAPTEESFDHVVLATGYEPSFDDAGIRKLVGQDPEDDTPLSVARDFRVRASTEPSTGGVYMNGNVSDSHGPAEDVLSVISHRARDILAAMRADARSRVKRTVPTPALAESP